MGTKSPAEIMESAIVAHLVAQTELAGVSIDKGVEIEKLTLPSIIVTASGIGTVNELPEGLGNFSATITVQMFGSSDASNALSLHRDRSAAVLGAMQDVTAIKAVFTSQADATCYDVIFESTEEGQADRALMASFTYKALIVLPS
jgi:hypothetical protein